MDIDLSIQSEEISLILKDFLKIYLKNARCKGIVIGLSGGIDSATVAVFCNKIFGKKNTQCLFLPDSTTPKKDKEDIKTLATTFDLNIKEIEISSLIEHLSTACSIKPDKLARANIKARLRMLLLYEHANMTNSLVCGTSNKSELLIGYCTKYGDGGVDIQPLGDLYKTQVYQFAEYLCIPKAIITKSPTAGLWENQTDEKELGMTYKQLDTILYFLERKIPPQIITATYHLNKEMVEKVIKMRKNCQHKQQTPLIAKLGLRTPGLDWRAPLLEG